MSVKSYDTFEIRISGDPHRLDVHCPAGSASIELGDRLGAVRARLGRSRRSAETKGGALFDLLLRDEIRRLWERSLASSIQKGRGLCLRFHFDLRQSDQARLAAIPWELLFDPGQERFLALSMHTPIVRFLEMAERLPAFDLPARIRILGVVSQPRDLETLDLDAELVGLSNGWAQDNVEVDVISGLSGIPGSPEDLGSVLRQRLREKEYHVLHFMGHGTFEMFSNQGFLFFEDRHRRSVRVSGQALATWLLNHPSLRLIVLNACSSGRSTSDVQRPFAGVAQALVRGGVAGALAMQDPMPDDRALLFSRVFYQRLADGFPVEAALSEARLELHAIAPDDDSWSAPVLFQRTAEIVRVPPKIGPTLTRIWSLAGSIHLLFVLVMFLRNRSVALPVIYQTMTGEVAAFFGIFFGLPCFYLALHAAMEHAKTTKLPAPAADQSAVRRLALRLPVTFQARIQGRIFNENVYQLLALLLLVVFPMTLQILLYTDLMRSQVWIHREKILFTSSFEESLTRYVPLDEALLNDTFRIGSIDDRSGIEKLINNVTYFPFWEAWFLMLAELVALGMCLQLIRRLLSAEPSRRP